MERERERERERSRTVEAIFLEVKRKSSNRRAAFYIKPSCVPCFKASVAAESLAMDGLTS